jgi:hypothetical protein
MVEIEKHLFLGKRIVPLLPAAHIKLNATVHAKSHCSPLLVSSPLLSNSMFAALHPLLLHNGW